MPYVCVTCVEDPALQAVVRENAPAEECDYCNAMSDDANAADVSEIAGFISDRRGGRTGRSSSGACGSVPTGCCHRGVPGYRVSSKRRRSAPWAPTAEADALECDQDSGVGNTHQLHAVGCSQRRASPSEQSRTRFRDTDQPP